MDNSKLTRLDRIEGLRRENGLTLEQLAERTGLSSSVLSAYENNERNPQFLSHGFHQEVIPRFLLLAPSQDLALD